MKKLAGSVELEQDRRFAGNQRFSLETAGNGGLGLGRFYSALQKLNTPQTTKTAQIISFIERVRFPLDCILLEGWGGTTFTDTAQVVLGPPQFCPLLPCFPTISDGCVET